MQADSVMAFEPWPKRKSGIRPNFNQMKQAQHAHLRWRALTWVTRLHGKQTGDLWQQKRPSKTVSKVDKEVKLRADLITNPPEHFPDLKFAGCSLQYIIMLNECLGGAKWYKPYIRRPDEYVQRTAVSKNEMDAMLKEFAKNDAR
jgi:hypothetical protein